MSKNISIAKEAGIDGDDEKEFIVTGISLLEVRRVSWINIWYANDS
jgi:hypothetical protein